MDKIKKIDKTSPVKSAVLKKNKSYSENNMFLSELKKKTVDSFHGNEIDDSFEKHNEGVHDGFSQKKNNDGDEEKSKKQFLGDIREVIIAAERAIEKFNRIFDTAKSEYYMFYEIMENGKEIIITVANSKSGEFIYRHNICIECMKSENDFYKVIDDFLRDKGLIIDYQA
ncbi:hypothetical protein KA977_11450 [Candidatus Dependentiae bacterium]|nr:hypothetical protein [Candidatus Dependentiae bacterium]